MYYYKIKLTFLALPVLIGLTLLGCKKLIEVDLPIDKTTAEATFSNVNTAVQAVNGIYAVMAKDVPFVGSGGLSIRRSLMADELKVIGADPFYTWDYNGSENGGLSGDFWTFSYRVIIYRINSALEGISSSATLPEKAKQTLLGELKFTRAWIYFLLVNSYGDVPLVLSTDFNINANIPRINVTEVYKRIESDLLEAQILLDDNFLEKDLVTSSTQRVRPNRVAATALLARLYLYMERWVDAEMQSSKIINNNNFELLNNLDQVFLKDNKESIWQLQASNKDPDGYNAPDGRALISANGSNEPQFTVSPFLLAAFEPNDQRKLHWIGTSPAGRLYAYKYKEKWRSMNIKEYTVVFRLGEQYLIRAEARAMQGKLTGENSSASDLNRIRNRAGLGNTSTTSQEGLLTAIDKERQVELFLEWGDRWFNLKRRKKIDATMSLIAPQKGGAWQSYKSLLPISWEEFKYNPALRGHQNPGYPEQ